MKAKREEEIENGGGEDRDILYLDLMLWIGEARESSSLGVGYRCY